MVLILWFLFVSHLCSYIVCMLMVTYLYLCGCHGHICATTDSRKFIPVHLAFLTTDTHYVPSEHELLNRSIYSADMVPKPLSNRDPGWIDVLLRPLIEISTQSETNNFRG